MEDRVRATAKWGAACAACASAKAKCIRTNEAPGSKCDRCERLFKECTGQVHRPRKKRTSKPSKTAQLEERLNGLVDLLRASGELSANEQGQTSRSHSASFSRAQTSEASPGDSPAQDGRRLDDPPSVPRSSSVHTAHTAHTPATASSAAISTGTTGTTTIPTTYNSFAPPTCVCRPETGEINLDCVDSDDELLHRFRTHMVPLYPFAAVSPTATVAELEAHHPFLFTAIKCVASMDNMRSMQGQMYQLISHVAENMLLRSERSLDLLQGLLVVIGWYHHHCMMHAQLNNLVHLCIALLSDLQLNRPPRLAERTHIMVLHPNEPKPRTNEERRALLGLWYISSCLAQCFQKTEPLRFSPYVRQCLRDIDEAREYKSDITLVALVRLQQLTERIGALNNRDDQNDDLPGFQRAPMIAYQKAFQTELDQLVAGFPDEVKSNKTIVYQLYTTVLRLHEPPLVDVATLQKLSACTTTTSAEQLSALDILYRSHTALTAYFDQFFLLPTDLYPWMPLPFCLQLIYGITMLSRWARLVGPLRPQSAGGGGGGGAGAGAGAGAGGGERNQNPNPLENPLTAIKDPSARLVPGQGAPVTPSSLPPTSTPASTSAASAASASSAVIDATRDAINPEFLASMVRLRETLRSQPGLYIDIPGILTRMGAQFEKSNHDLRAEGAAKFGDSVARGINVFDLMARKIGIMLTKISRWTSEGGEAMDAQQVATHVGGAETESGGRDSNSSNHNGMPYRHQHQQHQHQYPHQQPMQGNIQSELMGMHQQQQQQQQLPHGGVPGISMTGVGGSGGGGDVSMTVSSQGGMVNDLEPFAVTGWDCSSPWANDMFESLDPSLWGEGMDWASTDIPAMGQRAYY